MLDFAVENYIKTAKGLPFFYITGEWMTICKFQQTEIGGPCMDL